ncbi:hypothetical protein BGZ89_004429, partial [Linnemannia elongata]
IEAMSFSPDGHQLAVGTYRSIYLRDLQSDERAIKLRGHTELVKCIAYSPCGDWIASGSYDKTVRLWRRRRPPGDTESWSCVSTVHGFFGMIFDIAWSPTVPMEFVTGCVDESVRVWRVSNDGEDIAVKLLWGTNLTVLHADGLVLEGTTGLGSAEQKLLVQCGAFNGSLNEGDEEDDYTDSEGVESDDNTDSEGVESDDDTDSEGVESEDDTDSEGVELDDDMDSAGVESDDEE